MKRRITIKDIAKELNVHHSTVSRALRNDARVNEGTRDLILAYAREHDYQTNMNAVQLRGTENNTIALIVPNINHTFFSDIISQLTNIAYNSNYIISVFQSNEDYLQEVNIINTIIKQNYAGVIASISTQTTESKHYKLLQTFGIPLVFFDRMCADIQTPKVLVNNFDITFEATEFLINKGYKRIAHITGPTHINVFSERLKGYTEALVKHKHCFELNMEFDEEFSVELGKQSLMRLMSVPEKPDAIISSSTLITMGIALQAKEMQLEIPSQLGLIVFGNHLGTEVMSPKLTSISQPEDEIAALSFDLLIQMINNELPIGSNSTKEVKAVIIHRESC